MDGSPHFDDFKLLALGVGNVLMTDEAAGPRAVEMFESHHGHLPGLACMDAGTLSFTLAEDIGAADGLIVFDAARLWVAPGTVKVLEGDEMDAFVLTGQLTVHEVGIKDLLDMARVTGDLPARRALIAIEPKEIGWGLDLTPAVHAAMPRAVAAAREVSDRWIAEAAALHAELDA